MWPLGALAAVLLKILLDVLGVAHDLQWRLVLAAGAIPALAVLYFRRRMPETARYLAHLAGERAEASRVMTEISGISVIAPDADPRSFGTVFRRHARQILAAALLWMIYDLVVYVFILFGPNLIASSLGMTPTTFTLFTNIFFVLPASC